MSYVLMVVALIAGAALGLFIPDTDHWIPFLQHRSILTHGLIIPLIGYFLVRGRDQWLRMAVVGLCVATIAHLSYDLFPQQWRGLALIKIPGVRFEMGQHGTYSVLWMVGSLIVCWWLTLSLAKTLPELGLAGSFLVAVFLIAGSKESFVWSPVLVIAATLLLALLLPSTGVDALRKVRSKAPQGVTL